MDLHVRNENRFSVAATVSGAALSAARDSTELVRATVHNLARQMATHIVGKKIQSEMAGDFIIYRMDVYVLSPQELARLVDERARKLLESPGAHFIREQDHLMS